MPFHIFFILIIILIFILIKIQENIINPNKVFENTFPGVNVKFTEKVGSGGKNLYSELHKHFTKCLINNTKEYCIRTNPNKIEIPIRRVKYPKIYLGSYHDTKLTKSLFPQK